MSNGYVWWMTADGFIVAYNYCLIMFLDCLLLTLCLLLLVHFIENYISLEMLNISKKQIDTGNALRRIKWGTFNLCITATSCCLNWNFALSRRSLAESFHIFKKRFFAQIECEVPFFSVFVQCFIAPESKISLYTGSGLFSYSIDCK